MGHKGQGTLGEQGTKGVGPSAPGKFSGVKKVFEKYKLAEHVMKTFVGDPKEFR